MKVRPEVLRRGRPDGGLELYDPLLERFLALSPAEAAVLDAVERERPTDAADALAATLAAALLLEGPAATQLRERVLDARILPLAEAPAAVTRPFDPTLAASLPTVSPTWRDPEAWRRLAEEHAAGRERLVLRGFLPPSDAAALAEEVGATTFGRFETDRVRAWRSTGGDGPRVSAWRALLLDDRVRALIGGALGAPLPARLVTNAWRMAPGDGMRAHPDGRRYAATWALGLCAGWTAADAGAIAFGTPGPDRFVVHERWLPFAGDLCLFVPHAQSWHVVEPPRRERLTLSGWWVA